MARKTAYYWDACIFYEWLGKGADDETDYLGLFDAQRFHEVKVSTNILLLAREIRDYYFQAADENGSGGKMMDLGDCIHLATASINGVQFHTRDKDGKGSKVPLLKLYEPPRNPRLCGKYDLAIVSPESAQGAFDV